MYIPTNRVILTGRLRAGKDYVGHILKLQPIAMAEPLYEACKAILGSCQKEIPKHRRLLQLLGAWGRGTEVEAETELDLPTQEEITKLFRESPEKLLKETHTSLEINWREFGLREDFWILVAKTKAKDILKKDPEKRISIPNGRFPNEIEEFQKIGFLHLHVTCSEETRRMRPGANVSQMADNDITEQHAKKLDETMVGPCVIWNEPFKPIPEGKGYLPIQSLIQP